MSSPDRALGLVSLARGVLARGHKAQARDLAEQALAAAPDDPHVRVLVAGVLSHGIPEWHFDLILDQARNDAYDAALRRAVRPGMKVLEIGTGSGILAMMAARAGAAEVITCEVNPAIAAVAQANINANGYGDRVRVVAKHSTKLDVDADMDGPADLLVAEIVTNDILGEDALRLKAHARAELLKPGAALIPAVATARIALAHSDQVERVRVGVTDGFDLSALSRLAPPRWRLAVGSDSLVMRSDPADLFSFDFRSAPAREPDETATVVLKAEGAGPANCVIQWLELRMDSEIVYENCPRVGARSCWGILTHPFRRTEFLEAGTPVAVSGTCSANAIQIWTDRH